MSDLTLYSDAKNAYKDAVPPQLQAEHQQSWAGC